MKRTLWIVGIVLGGVGFFALGVVAGTSWRRGGVSASANAASAGARTTAVRTKDPTADTGAALLTQRLAGDQTLTRRELRERLQHLSAAEIPALLEKVLAQDVWSEGQWWTEALIERWVALDPRAAFAWTGSRSERWVRAGLRGEVLRRWAEAEPQVAADKTRTEMFGLAAQWALTGVLGTWGESDPVAAAAWLARQPQGAGLDEARKALLESWSGRDPMAALAWVRDAAPSRWRDRLLGNALGELARVDPVAALKEFEALPAGAARDRAAGRMIVSLAETDVKLAGDLALTMPAGAPRNEAVVEVARSLGRKSADEAVAWLNGNVTDSAARQDALRQVVGDLVQRTPAEAGKRLGLLTGMAREELSGQIASSWVRQDPVAAIAWIKTLDDATARSRAVSQGLGMLAFRDPELALKYATTDFANEDPARLWPRLASALSYSAPDRALAAVAAVPAGSIRNEYVSSLASEFAVSRPADAIALVQTLPAGAVRSEAAGRVATMWFADDPQAGAAAVGRVGDPALQAVLAEELAKRWLGTDAAVARAWISEAPLSAETKQRLLQPRR